MAELKVFAGSGLIPVGIVGVSVLTLGACDARDSDPFSTAGAGATITAGNTDGADGGDGNDDGNTTTGGADDDDDDAVDDDSAGDDGLKLDVAGADEDTGSPLDDDGGECAEVSETADVGLQPADIIIAVDNSGSMQFEAAAVQQNMNAFSSQIFLANIDAHVVLISSYPGDSNAGICVPTPLGSGGCPLNDDNPPGFMHVNDGVGSNDALQKIINHWPDYVGMLRPTAARHVLVVTDDDSDMDAGTFDAMFKGLDPANASYTFHAIAAPEDPVVACLLGTSCCITAAAPGDEYETLVTATSGVLGNLCDQEFQPIFDELSTAVIQGATLACEFTIPPPPEGESFNPDQVNVEFDDGAGNILEIGRVDSAADCAAVMDGWYYDDPDDPMSILVCPQTCDTVQGFQGASVSIKFGCDTIPAG